MIAFLRHLFLDDFGWKLFSLTLAILVWLTVTFASRKEIRTDERVFLNLPVSIVSSVEDVSDFNVNPSTVEVVVRGGVEAMQNLQSKDIRPLADLTGVATAGDVRKPVEVAVPAGVTFVRVVPEEVKVIFPPDR